MAYRYGFDATGEEIADACADQIRGKVVLTTGVSPGGLGAFFLQLIAKYEPKLLILAARDISKAQMTAETIAAASPGVKTRLLQLDLSSQEQIRRAAREVNAYRESIDVLVNNAGLIACPYSTTQDGLEMQFGSMHIGHFLFTNLIMGKILAAGDGARVVSVSSDGYRLGPVRFNDWSFEVCTLLELLDRSALTVCTPSMVKHTTSGAPTAKPRRRICCSPSLLQRSWARRA